MERFSYKALYHSGRKGMHWGERNYQNPDGTWTELGKERRRKGHNISSGYTSGFYGTNYSLYGNNYKSLHGSLLEQAKRTSNFPLKQTAMSAAEDAKLVNPNYDENSREYSHNCASCALAYMYRRLGLDVEAVPRYDGTNTRDMLDCCNGVFKERSAYENKTISQLADIIEYDLESNGSEDNVGVFDVHTQGKYTINHALNWERTQDGNIRFIDSQDPNFNVERWLEEYVFIENNYVDYNIAFADTSMATYDAKGRGFSRAEQLGLVKGR